MTHQISIMYCHNFTCTEYNRQQEINVIPATWEQPPELATDACPHCSGDLWSEPRDTDTFIDNLVDPLGDLQHEHQRMLAAKYEEALGEFMEQQRLKAIKNAHKTLELPF